MEANGEQLASRTIQRITDALGSRQVAGVPEVIRLIQELSSKAFTITIKELSDLISQDVAVTAKVISAANTVGYNPTGIPVSTISQAIQVIGFDRVRNLAVSLLLVENAEQSLTEAEQREASAFAISSGLIAQGVMERLGVGDPEQAFVCASLRNYGRLLMTTFLLDDYRDAEALKDELGEDKAFRKIFGLTPLELSYHLLLGSHLPKEILRTLQAIPPGQVYAAATRPEDNLMIVADMAVRLCEAATRDASPAEFNQLVEETFKRYDRAFHLRDDEVASLFQAVTAKLRHYSDTYGIRPLGSHTIRSIAARSIGRTPPEAPKPQLSARQTKRPTAEAQLTENEPEMRVDRKAPEIVSAPADSSPAPVATSPEETKEPAIRDPLIQALNEMTALLADRPVNYRKMMALALAGIKSALALDDVIYFDCEKDRRLSAIMGIGPLFALLRPRGTIELPPKDVVSLSIVRREDVLIENALDPRTAPYIPPWVHLHAPTQSFILLPAHEEGEVFALLYGARAEGALAPSAATLQRLRALRIHLATARRRM